MSRIEDTVLKAGFLVKCPPQHKAGTSFKSPRKRWFVLRSDIAKIFYYPSQDTKQTAKGHIDMEELVKIEGLREWPGAKKSEHQWVFVIEVASGREYHLSCESEAAMQEWVSTIAQRFESVLLQNLSRHGSDARSSRYVHGVITVDLSLANTTATQTQKVMVEANERSPTTAALAAVAKKAKVPSELLSKYALVLVNRQHFVCRRLNDQEIPLELLQKSPDSLFYFMPKLETQFALKRLRALDEEQDASATMRFTVKCLGSAHHEVDLNDAPEQDTAPMPAASSQDMQAALVNGALPEQLQSQVRRVPREESMQMYERVKKLPGGLNEKLTLAVGDDGIRVLMPSGVKKRPFTVVLELSLYNIVDCFDVDKDVVFVTITPPAVASLLKEVVTLTTTYTTHTHTRKHAQNKNPKQKQQPPMLTRRALLQTHTRACHVTAMMVPILITK
eukprot:m.229188 g.229188  ORF g.229188 m.229188 type:complete len:447 (+) comp15204_c1_seq12:203-1543(+)